MHSGRNSKLNMILRPLPLIGIRIRLVVAFQIIEKANFQKDGSSKASNECGGITQKEEVRSNSVLPTVDISIGHYLVKMGKYMYLPTYIHRYSHMGHYMNLQA